MGTPDPAPTRHLAPDTLDQYWSARVPVVIPIEGAPDCRIRIDPAAGLIALQTEYSQPEPNLAKLKNITFAGVVDSGTDMAEIAVRIETSPRGAYTLLTTIADGLQLRKQTLAVAVNHGVEQHKGVLAMRGGLSAETEVGLFGELLFLEHLIAQIGPAAAISAWQGPLNEEHDFVFSTARVEVKTTSTERRRHVIHGLKQLVPAPGTDLFLVSVQITRAPGDQARSLPGLVADVRTQAGGHVAALDRTLEGSGWRESDAAMYQNAWTLRSTPRAYAVGPGFPALTPERVTADLGRIDHVTYQVDLTGLQHVPGVWPISTFTEPIESKNA